MFKKIKNKLQQLELALIKKAQTGAELAVVQMKRRIFQQGLKANLTPIGRYKTGNRKGRPVKLKDTGQLERSIQVVFTPNGARIVGDGSKVRWLERRYGKMFSLSKDEIHLLI